MKEEQIERILASIRKCNPELMELSFGCEVENRRMNISKAVRQTVVSYKLTNKPGILDQMITVKNGRLTPEQWGNITNSDDIKIIGHEPHLEHLLRTLVELASQGKRLGDYAMAFNGQIIRFTRMDLVATYNLTLSLTQNLETNQTLREWVYKLICEEV